MRVNKFLEQEERPEPSTEAEEIQGKKLLTASNSSGLVRPNQGLKKKKAVAVRFKLGDQNNVDAKKNGVVRFRIVVTQEELNQILNCKKHSKYFFVEQLLNAKKVSSRRITQVRTASRDAGGGWKPVLESIPEDH